MRAAILSASCRAEKTNMGASMWTIPLRCAGLTARKYSTLFKLQTSRAGNTPKPSSLLSWKGLVSTPVQTVHLWTRITSVQWCISRVVSRGMALTMETSLRYKIWITEFGFWGFLLFVPSCSSYLFEELMHRQVGYYMQFIVFMVTFDLEESLVCSVCVWTLFCISYIPMEEEKVSIGICLCVYISIYLKKELYGLNMFLRWFYLLPSAYNFLNSFLSIHVAITPNSSS